MKLERPPEVETDSSTVLRILNGEFDGYLAKVDERYLYWDEVKYQKESALGSAHKDWSLIKTYRAFKNQPIKIGTNTFTYYLTSHFSKDLHDFDLKLMGDLRENKFSDLDKFSFFKNSLLEEAVASSQVEGASTTTDVAREMLKSGRSPRNESEQMIFNNLRAINYINEFQDSKIDFPLIIQLHELMTANTKAESCSGAFRSSMVFVTDQVDGEIAHLPPPPELVENLMEELCDFINDDSKFIHPIVKAAIIHFLVGYVHPFLDGNGRTARALFYWYLLKKGYKLIKNISISRVILESRVQYDKAFLKTEYDDNDLNYFIAYSIKNIRVAFEKMVKYRNKKIEEKNKSILMIHHLEEQGFNRRQATFLSFIYFKNKQVSLNEYATNNDVVRQTASSDLKELVRLGLVKEDKNARPYQYGLCDKKAIEAYMPH